MLHDLLNGEIHFLLSGETAQTETNAGMGQVLLHPNGTQDVGGLQ